MIHAVPTQLNGYQIIEIRYHQNCATVMVYRPDEERAPYVVATWWPELGTTWSWGHYCTTEAEADETFAEVRAKNARR